MFKKLICIFVFVFSILPLFFCFFSVFLYSSDKTFILSRSILNNKIDWSKYYYISKFEQQKIKKEQEFYLLLKQNREDIERQIEIEKKKETKKELVKTVNNNYADIDVIGLIGMDVENLKDVNEYYKINKEDYVKKLSKFSNVNIFFTFDDGPSVYTSDIMNILDENSVKASFFVVADNISSYIDVFKRIVRDGHDVGSHTLHHIMMSKIKSYDSIKLDLKKSDEIIKKYYPNLIFFRVPGLEYSSRINKKIISDFNYKIIYGYCPDDWKFYHDGGHIAITTATLRGVYEYLKLGAKNIIICLHDGGGNRKQTVLSTSELIKIFKSLNFCILKLSDYY